VKEYEGRVREREMLEKGKVKMLGDDGLTTSRHDGKATAMKMEGAMASSEIIGGFEPKVTNM
jgi:hypothetical protein